MHPSSILVLILSSSKHLHRQERCIFRVWIPTLLMSHVPSPHPISTLRDCLEVRNLLKGISELLWAWTPGHLQSWNPSPQDDAATTGFTVGMVLSDLPAFFQTWHLVFAGRFKLQSKLTALGRILVGPLHLDDGDRCAHWDPFPGHFPKLVPPVNHVSEVWG